MQADRRLSRQESYILSTSLQGARGLYWRRSWIRTRREFKDRRRLRRRFSDHRTGRSFKILTVNAGGPPEPRKGLKCLGRFQRRKSLLMVQLKSFLPPFPLVPESVHVMNVYAKKA